MYIYMYIYVYMYIYIYNAVDLVVRAVRVRLAPLLLAIQIRPILGVWVVLSIILLGLGMRRIPHEVLLHLRDSPPRIHIPPYGVGKVLDGVWKRV